MKIIKLVAENVKGLKAVEIVPNGTLQVISGKNGQGKSSVLDSIWLALGGADATKGSNTTRAIRDGEESAFVTLDLGDIIATRKWTSNDKSTLKVESKDGTVFSSPQSMMNNLVGKLSFDPLSFSNLDNKKQLEILLDMVKLPKNPSELDEEKKMVYDERTLVNRELKNLKLLSDSLPVLLDGLPLEETQASDILAESNKLPSIIRITLSSGFSDIAIAIETLSRSAVEHCLNGTPL
ncbi:AAA family ATPase [Sporosarcina sp. FSL K6-1508]|uniref:AAA family ATPase n=1 Tax=Sporosarcina sp. FSL K6-1508 TaxID=2921553 RepID=UPI0030FA60E3